MNPIKWFNFVFQLMQCNTKTANQDPVNKDGNSLVFTKNQNKET